MNTDIYKYDAFQLLFQLIVAHAHYLGHLRTQALASDTIIGCSKRPRHWRSGAPFLSYPLCNLLLSIFSCLPSFPFFFTPPALPLTPTRPPDLLSFIFGLLMATTLCFQWRPVEAAHLRVFKPCIDHFTGRSVAGAIRRRVTVQY